jgi:branched-chain amino acid aminotransferase
LRLELPFSAATLISEIQRTAAAFRRHESYAGEMYVRLQLTRGAGPIGLDPALADRASWVVLVQSLKIPAPAPGRAGLQLSVARDLRRNSPEALNPAWKTGNYLNNLLCLREAKSRGADEVVILNEAGAVSEAAVCNIFFGQGLELVTPPLSAGILEGITRLLILRDIAARAGLAVREDTVRPTAFAEFAECFLSSSTRDVAPVEMIDDQRFTIGPNTASARLKAAFETYTLEYAGAHAELKM